MTQNGLNNTASVRQTTVSFYGIATITQSGNRLNATISQEPFINSGQATIAQQGNDKQATIWILGCTGSPCRPAQSPICSSIRLRKCPRFGDGHHWFAAGGSHGCLTGNLLPEWGSHFPDGNGHAQQHAEMVRYGSQQCDPYNAVPILATTALGTFTYYVARTNGNGCESDKVSISVRIGLVPTAPLVSPMPIIYCQGAVASLLTVTATAPNAILNGYTQAVSNTCRSRVSNRSSHSEAF